jgi:hypothetical protein
VSSPDELRNEIRRAFATAVVLQGHVERAAFTELPWEELLEEHTSERLELVELAQELASRLRAVLEELDSSLED